ncbi:hypothetical protein BDZ89DRAFT_1116160 [Hymenopellis radicata]|nr:hypothetical protein BDZ89DRAFT_1116160 [Hymenopellis radicata]
MSESQLSCTGTASAPSCIDASENSSHGGATKDAHPGLALPKSLPTNLSRLLRSNYPPTSQDAVVIWRWICLLDNWLTRLDVAIAQSLTLIMSTSCDKHRQTRASEGRQKTRRLSFDKLKKQRADVRRLRAQIQSLNSTVRRLPPEIWQEVFLCVLGGARIYVSDPPGPVYVLGQVCQMWRDASRSCPQLWSRPCISVMPRLSLVASSHVSRLREVLKRSGDLSLDFRFEQWSSDHEQCTALLTLLMQHSSKWKRVKFSQLTFTDVLVLEGIRGRVPRLESVKLDLVAESDEPERTEMLSAFEIVPKLSCIALCNLSLGHVLFNSRTKKNIEYLAVRHSVDEEDLMFSCSTPALSEIVRGYPNLASFTVCCIDQRLGPHSHVNLPTLPPSAAPRFVHTNLRYLAVVGGGDCLNLVSLPNLVELWVGSDDQGFIHGLVPCVISLLQHSRCLLRDLFLRFPSWNEKSMGVLLGLLPELDTLTIDSGGLPGIDRMFRVLTRYLAATQEEKEGDGAVPLRPKYLPRLKTVFIHLPKYETIPQWAFIDGEFFDMLSMRGAHGLEVFHLGGKYDVTVDVPNREFSEQWKNMKKAGLLAESLAPLDAR